MCPYPTFVAASVEYIRDVYRGRHSDPLRFYRIEQYAQKRWEQSRDPRHYTRWQKLMTAVKRRRG